MKKHIFKRIFIIHIIVLLLSVVFIEFYITNIVRNNYLDNLKESLFIQAELISSSMTFDDAAKYDSLCRQLKKKTGSRVTFIDAKGKVLGDSDKDSSMMNNHADRPEVQQSNHEGIGWLIRHSDTLKYDLLYVSKRVIRDGKLDGFVRLAIPLKEIDKSINILRLKINLVVILLFLISSLLLIRQTERVRKFVNQIKDYSGALAQGLFKRKLYIEGAGEFTELAHNLNDMAEKLEENITKINEETNRLNVILKSIPDAMLLINTEGTIELSNKAAKELFHNSQLVGIPFIEIVRNPELSSLFDRVKQESIASSADIVMDVPEEKHLAVRVSPLFYTVGEMAGMVAIFHDMTQMKKLEHMRKDFVANVSHEIKTPVTAIQGFAETLLDGALEDRENAEKFLATIKNHSERLNRLVEDLLTISRIELGVIKIHKQKLDLTDIIDNTSGTMTVQAAQKNIIIKKVFKKGKNVIEADRDRLEQVLLNLLDNAIKFTESGEITVGTAQEGESTYFFVKDTGMGIPRKYISRLGERFFRVDPSRSRELGGTGLGLAIVKHLVMAHGWEIKIESEMEKGAIVKIFYSK